jgi:hypothetical protein
MRRTKEHITVASIAVGYRLIEAKRLEGHGGWLPWLAARGINERTARRTMELASHHEYLTDEHPEKLPGFMSKSLRQALAIVHEERAAAKSGKPRPRGRGKIQQAPEVEILPPDPVHVLHHLAQQWPAAEIERYQLSQEQADLLEEDLPVVLPALVELAARHDVSTGIAQAEEVADLDAVAQVVKTAHASGCLAGQIIKAVVEALGGEWPNSDAPRFRIIPVYEDAPAASQADLEAFAQRVATWIGDRTQTSAADALGISVPTLRKVLAGEPVRVNKRCRIEARLSLAQEL